jgi:hypothetical protein
LKKNQEGKPKFQLFGDEIKWKHSEEEKAIHANHREGEGKKMDNWQIETKQ